MTFDDERFQNKNVEVRRWSCTIVQSYFVSYSLCAIAFVSSFPFLFFFVLFWLVVVVIVVFFFLSAYCFLSVTYRYIINHLMKYIKCRWNCWPFYRTFAFICVIFVSVPADTPVSLVGKSDLTHCTFPWARIFMKLTWVLEILSQVNMISEVTVVLF